jgi:hypothetical protein
LKPWEIPSPLGLWEPHCLKYFVHLGIIKKQWSRLRLTDWGSYLGARNPIV